MASQSPDTGQFKQDVTVNGLPYHAFDRHWKHLKVGDQLYLQRVKNNLHDARAVAVATQRHGDQLGWIPAVVNKEIAALLDQGIMLYAHVTRVNQADLGIQVTDYAVSAPGKAPYPRPKLHLGDTVRQGPQRKVPEGTVMVLRTNDGRSTITVVDPHSYNDLYYFHKGDLPAPVEAALLKRTLHLVKRGERYDVEEYWSDKSSSEDAGTVSVEFVSPTGRTTNHTPEFQQFPTTEKGNTMSLSSKTTDFVNNNKSAAQQAAYLEAGRIANNQVVKLSSKALPMMARGYADTPIGKLLAANIAQMAAAQLRPNDPTLAKLTGAMTVAAYQEVIQTVDIEGWLDELLSTPAIKRAVDKLGESDSSKFDGRPGAQ